MVTPEIKWKVATGVLGLGVLVLLVLFGREWFENALLQEEIKGISSEIEE